MIQTGPVGNVDLLVAPLQRVLDPSLLSTLLAVVAPLFLVSRGVLAGCDCRTCFLGPLIGGALPLFDAIDQLQLTHPWSPYASFFIGLLLCLAYPTLQKWNTARGDTTIIVGVAAGVSVGSWLAFQHGMLVDPHQPRPYPVVWPTALQHGLSLIRMGVGIVIIWATRAVFKVLTFNLASRLWGFDPHDRATKKKIQVELPHKYLTYYAIAFNVIYVCPTVFRYLGVSRDVTFTEL